MKKDCVHHVTENPFLFPRFVYFTENVTDYPVPLISKDNLVVYLVLKTLRIRVDYLPVFAQIPTSRTLSRMTGF